MRSCLAIFTIISLLACPIACATKRAIAQVAGQETKQSCCGQCQKCPTSKSSDAPVTPKPTPDQEGRCCVCENGAIFVTTDRTLIDGPSETSAWTWIDCPSGSLETNQTQVSEDRVSGLPPWRGIERRIALHSLQV